MQAFRRILQAHRARYPLMEPQDYAKLAFQSEFGPEHMVADAADAAARLLTEWETVPDSRMDTLIEPIGNGLCRFHLTAAYVPQEAAPVLARLFVESAAAHKGTNEGLLARLRLLEALPVSGMAEWLAAYRRRGRPAVHHSAAYRAAYRPHYRVVLLQALRSSPLLPPASPDCILSVCRQEGGGCLP